MNILRRTNQKNLGFRKSMELRVNGGSNTTTLSDVAVYNLNLAETESIALGTDNGEVFLVKLADKTGFELKGNNINTKQFSVELLSGFNIQDRANNFIFTIGEETIINGMSCRQLMLVSKTALTVRKVKTTTAPTTVV